MGGTPYRTDVTSDREQAASVTHTVTAADTAIAFGSGDVDVLATPRALAWCEEATMALAAPHLDDDLTTVGMRVTLEHIKPAPIGAVVTATARADRIEGRRYTFSVVLTDETGDIVTQGTVVRVLVHTERFMQRATGTA